MIRRLLLILLLCTATMAHASIFSFGSKKPTFLPADQAFSLEVHSIDQRTLIASFNVTPSYYLYRNKITFSTPDGKTRIASVTLPKGETKNDPNFGTLEVYHQSFQTEIVLENADAAKPLVLNASYQGCSDNGLCYPPIEKTFNVALAQTVSAAGPESISPAVPGNENTQIAKLFKNGSFWLIVSFFFGAGLLLSLTPCVFPMIPILSGIIVGRGHKITHMHAFFLSLAYVLGMAITYAIAGVAAGYSGNLISNALQTPWVLGSFAAVFVVLSLAMFGLYELQLPTALQSRLSDTSNKLHGGHISGVFAMGALSAIIMGPCVAAPLAGALLYISQTHDAVLGGVALFVLALGMGAPLLLIGTSAGALLPKAGAWMEAVKRFFGVLMLAMAIWIVSPVIAVSVQMMLWAALLIFSAIYLHALDPLPHNAHGLNKLGKGMGILALLLGVAYLIGALSGARDMLRPLGNIVHASAETPATLRFERVKGITGLDARITRAKGQTVMLDFYADWCVSCKEMERFTFSDSTVQAKLKNAVLLQADVTANDADDKALLQRFQIFGPPATLFFDAAGKELSDFRVTGYQDAPQFLQSLKNTGL
ncbi:protein-disulfide reductase DsbD [Sideroxydans lithotrophicus]|uniref:Thiol:disulfide interchange protein DsbD n=1 Tax=Sideroxydans lithotrophicus (strain ES-1) TaxID=580332 RepID=D5CPT1_SIDLE|nr:protein-disulfide reductase DsbD [Sideroxydans lithotrophicus]ADE13076.1 cytochrome c biogenesis protein transmembrane region [Sideroxydans lithotrophicus ES-1]